MNRLQNGVPVVEILTGRILVSDEDLLLFSLIVFHQAITFFQHLFTLNGFFPLA